MEQVSYYINLPSNPVAILAWIGFAAAFLLRKRTTSSPDTRREPMSWFGLILQGFGLAIVGTIRRKPFASPFIDEQFAINIALQTVSIVLAILSAWPVSAAIRELGKQWSLQARLIEGHKLVTTGVYSIVRHPIYTSLLGMLLAGGVASSHWIGLLSGLIVFLSGTKIRTNIEETLLRDAFGDEFEGWKIKVPGLIPFLKTLGLYYLV